MANLDFINDEMVADGYEYYVCEDIAEDYRAEVKAASVNSMVTIGAADFTKPSLFMPGDHRLKRIFVIPVLRPVQEPVGKILSDSCMTVVFDRYCSTHRIGDRQYSISEIDDADILSGNTKDIGMLYSVRLHNQQIFTFLSRVGTEENGTKSSILAYKNATHESCISALSTIQKYDNSGSMFCAFVDSLHACQPDLYELGVRHIMQPGDTYSDGELALNNRRLWVSTYIASVINIANDLLDNRGVIPVVAAAKRKVVTGKKRIVSWKGIEYKVIDLKPYRAIYEQAFPSQSLVKALMSSHQVRGHFATYTEDKPLFGHFVGTCWRKPHVRGDKSVGEVKHAYNIVT